jgi:iduronate 2-sulfatase
MRQEIHMNLKMNKRIKLLFIPLLFTLVSNATMASVGGAGNDMNVLLIIVDDLRPELGCYKTTQVISPNIDQIAREGILFTRTYCQIPICGASRASLLSGLRPTTNRFLNYDSRVDDDAPGHLTLPGLFKTNGYHTISNGKVFHIPKDAETMSWSEPAWEPLFSHKGFIEQTSSQYIGGTRTRTRGPWFEGADVDDFQYTDGETTLKTIADLKRMKKEDKRFFIACGLHRPHLPFYIPKKYWDLYNRDKILLAQNRYMPDSIPSSLRASGDFNFYHHKNIEFNSDEFHKVARHGYYACVSYIDQLIGYLMDALKELDLQKNTIVMIIGDHGWHLGEHNLWSKHNLLHNATHSPMILRIPGGPSNSRITALTEFVDIYPTLADLAEVDIPPEIQNKLQGLSILPLLNKYQPSLKNAVFCRFQNGETIVTDRYSYTEYIKEDGVIERMLFDLRTDPEENINLIAEPGNEELIIELDKRLHNGWENAISSKK